MKEIEKTLDLLSFSKANFKMSSIISEILSDLDLDYVWNFNNHKISRYTQKDDAGNCVITKNYVLAYQKDKIHKKLSTSLLHTMKREPEREIVVVHPIVDRDFVLAYRGELTRKNKWYNMPPLPRKLHYLKHYLHMQSTVALHRFSKTQDDDADEEDVLVVRVTERFVSDLANIRPLAQMFTVDTPNTFDVENVNMEKFIRAYETYSVANYGPFEPQMFNLLDTTALSDRLALSADKFDELLESVMELVPNVSNSVSSVEEITSKLADISKKLDRVKPTDVVDSFCSAAGLHLSETISHLGKQGLSIVVAATALTYGWYNPNRYSIGIALLTTGLACYMNQEMIMRFVTPIMRLFNRNEVRAQDGISSDAFFTALSGILGVFALGKESDVYKGIAVSFDRLKGLNSVATNFKTLFSAIVEILVSITRQMGLSEYIPSDLRVWNINEKQVAEVMKRSGEIVDKMEKDTFYLSQQNFDYLITTIDELKTLLMNLHGTSSSGVGTLIRNEIATLTRIRERFAAAKFCRDTRRVEPVAMIFRAGPGVLKSQAAEFVARQIVANTVTAEEFEKFDADPGRCIYARNSNTEYWDGYKNQPVVFFDDFLQFRDVVGSTVSQPAEFVDARNETAFQLPMAHLEKKGGTYFTSPFMICTTNSPNLHVESIIEPGALWRRMDFVFTVAPKVEYLKEGHCQGDFEAKIDFSKLPLGELGVPSIEPSCLEFLEYDLFTEQHTGKKYSYEEICVLAVEKHKLKKLWFDQKTLQLDAIRPQVNMLPMPQGGFTLPERYTTVGAYSFNIGFDEEHYQIAKEYCAYLDSDNTLTPLTTPVKHKNTHFEAMFFQIFAHMPTPDEKARFLSVILSADPFFLEIFENDDTSLTSFAIILQTHITPETFDRISISYPVFHTRRLLKLMGDKISEALAYAQKFFTPMYHQTISFIKKHMPIIVAGLVLLGIGVVADRTIKSERPWHDIYIEVWGDPETGVAYFDINHLFHLKKFYNDVCPPPGIPLSDIYKIKTTWIDKDLYWDLEFVDALLMSSVELEAQYKKGKGKNKQKKGKSSKVQKAISTMDSYGTMQAYEYFESQMGHFTDKQGMEITQNVVESNQYVLEYVEDSETTNSFGYVLFITGRLAICPKHYITILQMKVQLYPEVATDMLRVVRKSRKNTTVVQATYSIQEFLKMVIPSEEGDAIDLGFVNFDKKVNSHRSIIENFFEADYFKGKERFDIKLTAIAHDSLNTCFSAAVRSHSTVVGGDEIPKYTVRDTVVYRAATEPGDCGALVTLLDGSTGKKKIIGIHIAGNPGSMIGIGNIIDAKLLREIAKKLPSNSTVAVILPECLEPNSGITVLDDRFRSIGIYPQKMHMPRNSKIIPSLLAGMWSEVKMKPAYLHDFVHDGVKRIPLDMALSKYCTPFVDISGIWIRMAADHLGATLRQRCDTPKFKRVLTFEETICGIPEFPDYGGMARTTSPGIPYIFDKKPGHKGKQSIFGKDEVINFTTSEMLSLRADVENIISNAKKGVRLTHIFGDALKDERRPIAKVNEGKTRLYSISPLDYGAAFRMYFGAFTYWMVTNFVRNGTSIGLNPYTDWEMLYAQINRMLEVPSIDPQKFGAGDFSGFDGAQKPAVQWAILDIIQAWYGGTPEEERIRSVLWEEIVNSRHMLGDIVYEWFSSLPSGHVFTIVVNSLYCLMSFRLCWIQAHGLGALYEFNDHVEVQSMGDDNLFTVSKKYRDTFNEMTLVELMAAFGLKYTTDLKGVATTPFRKITEVGFLKRAFRYEPLIGAHIAPLDLSVILEIPYWTKKTAQAEDIVVNNCEIALTELSLHGEAVYNRYAPLITNALEEKYGRKLLLTHYFTVFTNTIISEGAWLQASQGLSPFEAASRSRESKKNMIMTQPSYKKKLDTTLLFASGDLLNEIKRLKLTPQSGVTAIGDVMMESNVGMKTDMTADQEVGNDVMGTVLHVANDAIARVSQPAMRADLPWEMRDIVRDPVDISVINFLQKPFPYFTGVFSSTDTRTTFSPRSFEIPLDTGIPMFANKMQGTFSYRATLVLTLQSNPNRFMQGRYILAFVHAGGPAHSTLNTTTAPGRWYFAHRYSLVQITQLPHVEFDLSKDTQVTLKIPYVNSTTANVYAPATNPNSLSTVGNWFLCPYSPLESASGSTTCSFSIYTHYEDIELLGNTFPQSGVSVKGKRGRIDIVTDEAHSAGPVTTALQVAGKVAGVASEFPLLTSVATPLKWFLDLGAGVASVFGWSKPLVVDSGQRINDNTFPHITAADTRDFSNMLALSVDNQVDVLPGFGGTTTDEMGIDFLKSIPSFHQIITIPIATATGTVLASYNLTPFTFKQLVSDTSNSLTCYTPIAYLASRYTYYSGSINLHFKIIKTEFHSGRLLVSFYPVDSLVNVAPVETATTRAYVHRQIIDIRDKSEFILNFPYMQTRPWLLADQFYGTVVISVKDSITAPANVPSNIKLIVEASGGRDLQFSVPAPLTDMPVVPLTIQSGVGVANKTALVNIVQKTIGGMDEGDLNHSVAAHSIGESTTSLRQLLKRGSVCVTTQSPTTYTDVRLIPTSWGFPRSLAAASWATGDYPVDYFAQFSSMYALSRGGVRMKVLAHVTTANNAGSYATLNTLPASTLSTTSFITRYTVGASERVRQMVGKPIALDWKNNGSLQIQVPQYTTTHSRSCMAEAFNGSNAYGSDCIRFVSGNYVECCVVASLNYMWFRAGADDCNFGCFVSIPPHSAITNGMITPTAP